MDDNTYLSVQLKHQTICPTFHFRRKIKKSRIVSLSFLTSECPLCPPCRTDFACCYSFNSQGVRDGRSESEQPYHSPSLSFLSAQQTQTRHPSCFFIALGESPYKTSSACQPRRFIILCDDDGGTNRRARGQGQIGLNVCAYAHACAKRVS